MPYRGTVTHVLTPLRYNNKSAVIFFLTNVSVVVIAKITHF